MQIPVEAFARLVNIMDELREKCPWDKKQTIHTLRQLSIEEWYELADAITEEDWNGIKEELGDLMLHILFYAKNDLRVIHYGFVKLMLFAKSKHH